ncbi:MAG TPA: glycosyltransferase family 9 protein [Verrucomicrobiae bacterium]
MATSCITILGRTYLRGRKFNTPILAFLVARDIGLSPFLKARRVPLPQPADLKEICVCQIDHLGDVLMITPVLGELRKFAPQAKITLAVGRWCEELALVLKAGGLVDECITYTAWPLDPSRRSVFAKMRESYRSWRLATRTLRSKKVDAFFDLRPWSPNAWLLAHSSRATLRVGYGLRGMADVYNCIPPYAADRSTGQAHLDALQILTGKKCSYTAPILPSVPIAAHLDLPKSGYFVAQLFSREATRNLPPELWAEVLRRLAQCKPVVLVGAPNDLARAGDLVKVPGVVCVIGKTSIPDMFGIIEQSNGIVSIDSLAPHVSLAYGKKTAVLMIESISNPRSFPDNNPNLKFFPAVTGAGEAIESFLSSAP